MSATDFKVCGNCRFVGRDKVNNGICRRRPPTVVAAPLVVPTIAGGRPKIDWIAQSIWPPVRDDTPACGDFRFAETMVN
jgi:hypothetical protein